MGSTFSSEPDLFWLRHRKLLGEVITHVMQNQMDKQAVSSFVHKESHKLPNTAESGTYSTMERHSSLHRKRAPYPDACQILAEQERS